MAEKLSKFRRPTRGWRLASIIMPAVAMILALNYTFHWRLFGFVFVDYAYLALLVALFLPLCFLWLPATKRSSKDRIPWYDILLFILSFAIPSYFFYHWQEIATGWSISAPLIATVLGFILWLIVLEGGRRAGGPVFAVIVAIFTFYPAFGSHMPGLLWSPPLPFSVVVNYHTMSEESIFGLVIRIFGQLFFGYMFFAIVIQQLGAGKFFTDLAAALVAKTRAGNAKIAIVASSLFGMISGDAISNVFVVGGFTIPAMKKEGLPAHFAAAVEACASSGGVLMPPVMGAVAFIMAEFLAIPYATVCVVAAVPAILYYVCLFAQIDAYAARIHLKPATEHTGIQAPPVWRTLYNNLHIIMGFLVMLALLFFLRLSAQGPWIGAAVSIVLAVFRKETRDYLRPLFLGIWEELSRILGDLMGIMAAVGMIIGGFVLSGLAYSLPNAVVGLAHGNIYLLLALGAFASFILGMGVTVSACYIFLAIVLAPGLVSGGIDLLAAHMYVLYWGTLSYITPPVALSAMAAATVAGADPIKTGYKACQLGIAKYILPVMFVLSPALVLRAPLTDILITVPAAFVGIVVLSGALEGYFWGVGNLRKLSRVLLFIAGILIVTPAVTPTLIGVGILVIIVGAARFLRERKLVTTFLVEQ